MSDGHDHDHDDAADAHHDHGFDGEPAKELPPDEPHTPGWLPLLGIALFVLGALFFVTQSDASTSGASGATGATGAAGANRDPHAGHDHPPAPQTVAAPQQPRPVQPVQAQPRPGGSALPNVKRLTPDQVQDLTKRMEEARKKQPEGGGAK